VLTQARRRFAISCTPPLLLLALSSVAAARPPIHRPPPQLELPTFAASDGTRIYPSYNANGKIIGASGTDAEGVDREIRFDTTVSWNKLYWDAQLPLNCYTQGYGGTCTVDGQTVEKVHLPEYCYPGFCQVATTVVTMTYLEGSVEQFHFKTTVDPYNSQMWTELGLPNRIYLGKAITGVRYRYGFDGRGEEHVLYSDGSDATSSFSIDTAHPDNNVVPTRFNSLFPLSQRSKYFEPVMGYLFSHSALADSANSPLQLFDVQTGMPIPWGRYFGDFLIALAAAGTCAETGGFGCVLSASTAGAGGDFWITETTPNPDGTVPADSLVNSWLLGICGGWDSIWLTVTNVYPPLGCGH
jgi:hypothetical protein